MSKRTIVLSFCRKASCGEFLVFGSLVLAVLSACLLAYTMCEGKEPIEKYNTIARPANIRPDYTATVIPPNIAPLNFLVQEEGLRYYVKIYSKQGKPIEVFSRSPKIIIPENPWHGLLNKNRGEELYFDIFVKTNDRWNLFSTITNKIANEDIDGYLVYRKMHPTHYLLNGKVGIYQRNLHQFDESLVLDNEYYKKDGCVNCHTFCRNRPDKMLLAIRSPTYGDSALLIEDGVVNNIDTKFTYTSWHPTGRLAVYSISNVCQFFHSARDEVRDAIDLNSALAYYVVDSKTVKTSPKISQKERLETYPTWSPDGRYLYFCSAPVLWLDQSQIPPERYNEVKYDLVRISYDLDSDKWGELETVLSAQDTAMTALLPRVSPDGRWLLLCMCNYGCFPAFQQDSDLYLMDLEAAQQTGRYEYRRLDINSDQSEAWHSWSSNSRWIAFSSKRDYGVFTRPYFSYVDESGRIYKPLLLPQKDPTFYDSYLKAYSLPELIVAPVQAKKEKLARIIRGSRKITVDVPITMATPGEVPAYEYPWRGRE